MSISKKQKKLTFIVLAVYLFLLIWLVIFKFNTDIYALSCFRSVNLIPFKGSMIINGKISIREIVLNVLVFVPLGVYVGVLKPKWTPFKRIIPCFCTSLLFESLQFAFSIGASDITDLMANTVGGIAGIGLCVLFKKIFKQKYIMVINLIGIVVEVAAFAMLSILL